MGHITHRCMCRLAGVIVALAGCTSGGAAQSFLGLFLADSPEYRMMGGNPFASTMDLSRPFFVASPEAASVRYQLWVDDVYHERRAGAPVSQWSGSTHAVDLNLPLSTGPLEPTLRMLVVANRTAASFSYDSGEDVAFDGNHSLVNLQYTMRIAGLFQWGVMVAHTSASPDRLRDFGASVSISLPRGGVGMWGGTFSSAQSLSLQSLQVDGLLPLDFREQRLGVSGVYRTESVQLTLRGYHGVVFSYSHLSRDKETRFLPSGRSFSGTALVTVKVPDGMELLALVEGDRFSGKGKFVSRESIYGSLTDMEYDRFSVQAGIRIETPGEFELVGDVQWQRLNGSVRGYAESWPFVSILSSPVAQRENIDGGGVLETIRAHAGGKARVTHWLGAGAGISWLRILPGLLVDSWESRFLGIGERARSTHKLSLQRADGLLFSAGFSLALGPTTLSYALSQFIPLGVKNTISGGGTVSPVVVESSPAPETSGGQFHYLSAAIRF